MLPRKRVLDIEISLGSREDFVSEIVYLAKMRKSSYVCAANVHMAIEAHESEFFKSVVDEADIVAPDGVPIAKALKLLYNIKQERIAGPDIMQDLLVEAEKYKLSIFLYGSTEEILRSIRENIKRKYPGAQIVGAYSPPFRSLTRREKEMIVNLINKSKANIIFVSLGCPKQEKWMAEMKGKINAVMIGVGGAFPVFAGVRRRAPKWMQKASLEWLYRLLQEPRRLFKRYAYTNSKFICLLLKELIDSKTDKSN